LAAAVKAVLLKLSVNLLVAAGGDGKKSLALGSMLCREANAGARIARHPGLFIEELRGLEVAIHLATKPRLLSENASAGLIE
jgi:hypothetical protein